MEFCPSHNHLGSPSPMEESFQVFFSLLALMGGPGPLAADTNGACMSRLTEMLSIPGADSRDIYPQVREFIFSLFSTQEIARAIQTINSHSHILPFQVYLSYSNLVSALNRLTSHDGLAYMPYSYEHFNTGNFPSVVEATLTSVIANLNELFQYFTLFYPHTSVPPAPSCPAFCCLFPATRHGSDSGSCTQPPSGLGGTEPIDPQVAEAIKTLFPPLTYLLSGNAKYQYTNVSCMAALPDMVGLWRFDADRAYVGYRKQIFDLMNSSAIQKAMSFLSQNPIKIPSNLLTLFMPLQDSYQNLFTPSKEAYLPATLEELYKSPANTKFTPTFTAYTNQLLALFNGYKKVDPTASYPPPSSHAEFCCSFPYQPPGCCGKTCPSTWKGYCGCGH